MQDTPDDSSESGEESKPALISDPRRYQRVRPTSGRSGSDGIPRAQRPPSARPSAARLHLERSRLRHQTSTLSETVPIIMEAVIESSDEDDAVGVEVTDEDIKSEGELFTEEEETEEEESDFHRELVTTETDDVSDQWEEGDLYLDEDCRDMMDFVGEAYEDEEEWKRVEVEWSEEKDHPQEGYRVTIVEVGEKIHEPDITDAGAQLKIVTAQATEATIGADFHPRPGPDEEYGTKRELEVEGSGGESGEDSDAEIISNLRAFSRTEEAAMACVLQDAVDQLSILAHTARAAKIAPDLAPRSLSERLEALDALEAEGRSQSQVSPSDESSRVDKIQKDRALVQEALRLQLVRLRLTPRAWPLRRVVREEERRVRQEEHLLAVLANSAQSVTSQLRAKLRAEGQEARKQLQILRDERSQLQDEARSLRARASFAAALSERWEHARLEQHQWRLHKEETQLQDGLKRAKRETQEERRANIELTEYLTQATQELHDASEEWERRYDQVTTEWDERLRNLKAERLEHGRQLRSLRKELNRRERFKREFSAYKAIRDRQLEERVAAQKAATRIQSWWRGTMVRKGLGQYKKAAKKKKKKKK